jgi:hypothetical protein
LKNFVAEYYFVVIFTRRDSRHFMLLKDVKDKPVLLVHLAADLRCTYSGFGPNARSFQTKLG